MAIFLFSLTQYENEGNKSHESSLASLKDSANSLDEKSLNQPSTKKSKVIYYISPSDSVEIYNIVKHVNSARGI